MQPAERPLVQPPMAAQFDRERRHDVPLPVMEKPEPEEEKKLDEQASIDAGSEKKADDTGKEAKAEKSMQPVVYCKMHNGRNCPICKAVTVTKGQSTSSAAEWLGSAASSSRDVKKPSGTSLEWFSGRVAGEYSGSAGILSSTRENRDGSGSSSGPRTKTDSSSWSWQSLEELPKLEELPVADGSTDDGGCRQLSLQRFRPPAMQVPWQVAPAASASDADALDG